MEVKGETNNKNGRNVEEKEEAQTKAKPYLVELGKGFEYSSN